MCVSVCLCVSYAPNQTPASLQTGLVFSLLEPQRCQPLAGAQEFSPVLNTSGESGTQPSVVGPEAHISRGFSLHAYLYKYKVR